MREKYVLLSKKHFSLNNPFRLILELCKVVIEAG